MAEAVKLGLPPWSPSIARRRPLAARACSSRPSSSRVRTPTDGSCTGSCATTAEHRPPRGRPQPKRSAGAGAPPAQPRTIRTRWVLPSSASAMATSPAERHAVELDRRHAPRHLLRIVDDDVVARGAIAEDQLEPGQARGMQGSITSSAPRSRKPRIDSRPARYIQPAEPVYHVQPPRPDVRRLARRRRRRRRRARPCSAGRRRACWRG